MALLVAGATTATTIVSDGGEPDSRGERGLRSASTSQPATAPARISLWWERAPRPVPNRRAVATFGWRRGGSAVLAGRLTTSDGKPIRGARLAVLAADGADPRAASRAVGELRSDRRGRFRAGIALDTGAARKVLAVSYIARTGGTFRAVSERATLRVSGAVSLRSVDRGPKRRTSIVLRGRARPAESTVVIQLRAPGTARYRNYAAVRPRPNGDWRTVVGLPVTAARGVWIARARLSGHRGASYLPATSAEEAVALR